MNIGAPARELGPVRSAPSLASTVLQLTEEIWREEELRQKSFRVHSRTQSLVLLFCGSEWPEMQVEKKSGWPHLAGTAVPVMREILDAHYERGGIILRAMAAKLLPHGTIEGHVDAHPSFSCAHRIHVPLLTNPDVIFLVGGRQITMDVGEAYEINNQMVHRVHNGGDEDRIHFIFDYVPPECVAAVPRDSRAAAHRDSLTA